jgi:hypothetical protein
MSSLKKFSKTAPIYFQNYNTIYDMLIYNCNGFNYNFNNYKPKLIGITGSANKCDKEFIANYISRRYFYEIIRFNDPIKDIAKVMFDFTEKQINDADMNKKDLTWDITPKQALDFLNKGICENKICDLLPHINNAFLAKLLVARMKNRKNYYVISDLCKHIEYNELLNANMEPLIVRFDEPLHKFMDAADTSPSYVSHISSETEYKLIPHHIMVINHEEKDRIIKKFEDDLGDFV